MILIFKVLVFSACFVHAFSQYRCPAGWPISYGNRCFRVEPAVAITWYDAKIECESLGGSLVIFDTKAVNDFMIPHLPGGIYWIGLHDMENEGTFIWVNMVLLTTYGYSNWGPDQPDNWGSGEDCVYAGGNGKWFDLICSSSQSTGFVCQTEMNVPMRCDEDDDWVSIGDMCYKTITSPKTWQSAKDHCAALDGELVTVKHELIQDHLTQLTASYTVWIGLSDIVSGITGEYTFVNGDTPLFAKWGTNQPSNIYTPNCVEIKSTDDGHWSTNNCASTNNFVCGKAEGSCEPGWHIYGGQCYQLNTFFPASWTDAKHTCDAQGAHLVTINNAAENQNMISKFELFQSAGIDRFWIGISDTVTDGTFQWADGTSTVPYDNWGINEPKDRPDEPDCGFMDTSTSTGKWQTSNCFLIQAFVCEIQVGQRVVPMPPGYGIGRCPSNWALHGDYCYLFETTLLKNFDDAKLACVSSGGRLASIESGDEQSFINSRLDNVRMRMVIGLQDANGDGEYDWIDGTTSEFTNWFPGKPGSGSGQRCALLEFDKTRLGQWNTYDCNSMNGYICKQRKGSGGIVTDSPRPTGSYNAKCGFGYEYSDAKSTCYKYVTDEFVDWLEAETRCRKSGGHLLSLENSNEQHFITGRLYGVNSPVLWIGANDRVEEGGWRWSDSTPFAYLNWAPGQPDNYFEGELGADCVQIVPTSGQWHDHKCDQELGYICKNKGILVDYFNVFRNSGLEGYLLYQLTDVYPEDCAQKCLEELLCKSFNYDKVNMACDLKRENQSADGLSTYPDDPFDYYEITSYPQQEVTTTLAPGSRCESGWFSFGSWCYILLFQKLQWNDARDVCRREGGDLVSIADMTENAFVTYLVQSACDQWHSNRTTTDYEYTYVPGPLKNERIMFEVRANSDVHIALSEFNYYVNDQYEIVIGGWHNTKSVIRRCLDCGHEEEVSTPQILSGSEFRGFWITFVDGTITVGKEGGEAFMTWTDPNPMTINYVGYSTGYGHDGEFRLCTKNTESGRVWIGLHDPLGQSHFEWTDRSKVTLTNWKNGEPNNYQGRLELCVNMWTDGYRAGYWNDGPCYTELRSICKKPKQVLPPTTGPMLFGCDLGWFGFHTSCYKFEFLAQRGWSASQRDCTTSGGHLVSINDNVEQSFLSSKLMQMTESWSYWTGLNDLGDLGTYTWEDGQQVTYTNWAINQPDTRNGDCVALSTGSTTGGLWSVMTCNIVQPYICEKLKPGFTLPPPFVPTTHSSIGCSDGWVGYNENCFLIVTQDSEENRKTWDEALTDCRNRGADLASLHSAAQSQYLVLNSGINDWANGYWIGLNQVDEDGGFVWSDRTPVNFIDWGNGQPNGGSNAKCVMMFFHATKNWDDQRCDKTANWICKIHKGQTPVSQVPIPTATRSTGCGGDLEWYYYGGKCYYVTNTESANRMSWQNARNFCNLNGAVLASIHTQQEQELILSLVDMRNTWAAWIGLREYEASSVYSWSDGTPLDYTFWSPNEPNDANGEEQCVEMRAHDGMWNDNNCGDRLSFVCKKDFGSTIPITQALTPGLPPNSYCPAGFIEHNNICYVFNGNDVSDWHAARDKCRNAGGDLATIHSQEQQAYMTSQLRNVESAMWIGFSDNNWEGQFRWTDGSPVNFVNWATGEPNGGTDENCVEMHFRGYGGYWNDMSCDSTAGYICQAKKDPRNSPPMVTQNYCKSGYQQYWDACYKVFTAPNTYSQARSYCQIDGGELVSIVDVYEQAYVEYHMLLAGQAFWIGLNDIAKSGRYQWTDGTPVLYTRWGNDEPSKGVNEGCVKMTTDGSWDDTSCQSTAGGMCKYWTGVQPTTPPPGQGSCPTNNTWVKYGGYCYHFSKSSERRSWPEAAYECGQIGGALLTMGSEAENAYIQNILKENNLNIWLGLKRNDDGGFSWTDGKPVSYTKWAPGEPNGLTAGEDCGEMYFTSGEWNDVDCYWDLGFVCKMEQLDSGVAGPVKTGGNGSNAGAIVGALLAVLIVIVIVVVVVYLYRSGRLPSSGVSLPTLSNKSTGFDVSVGFSPSIDPKIGIDDNVKFEMNASET
ncbi:C-type mannose receptor 2-like [Ptychodera flava]|uniref:C-type mannose receptor 2-like n=1 Tax=Ptychodera flava TaxID=63121 RepID=UPI003969EDAB